MNWTTRNTALFSGAPQVENFRRMPTIHPVRRIPRSSSSRPLKVAGTAASPPASYDVDGESRSTSALLDHIDLTGMIVLHRGQVVHEEYRHGTRPDTQTMAFSVTKSYISTLVACAIRDGAITGVEDAVDRYVPELAESGYGGVALRDVLQMSSGVRWDENYGDPKSDVGRFNHAFCEAGSFDEVACSLTREFEPGTYNRYNTCDTHVLGMVVSRATGTSLADYLATQLWEPLGMEDDAFILVDGRGMEAAGMGLNATLRDHAKLGLLFRNRGCLDGRSLLPDGWYEACTTATRSHLRPGPRANATYPEGYGYQWWIPDGSGCFAAIGVCNQFVWIDPVRDVVVAISAANRHFGHDVTDTIRVKRSLFALFHGIADSLAFRRTSAAAADV